MSTRNLRKALMELRDVTEDHPNTRVEQRALIADALMELEAIERAAKALDQDTEGEWSQPHWDAAIDLMERIAKEAS